MKIKQLSVFVENKAGRLTQIIKMLSDSEINIQAISVADTSDFGILRLIVNDPEKAKEILKKNDVTVSLTDVIAVSIPDVIGSFAKALEFLSDNGIAIEYSYAFINHCDDYASVILRTDNDDKALKILADSGYAKMDV